MELLVRLDGDWPADSLFELPEVTTALFLEDPGDLRVDPEHQAVSVEIRADLLDLGEDVVTNRRARLDRAGPRAVRTGLGELSFEAALHALARDDDQPEVGDLHGLRRRAVLPE